MHVSLHLLFILQYAQIIFKKNVVNACHFKNNVYLCIANEKTMHAKRGALVCYLKIFAKIAQLVEHDLAKVGVAGSSPVFRSILSTLI